MINLTKIVGYVTTGAIMSVFAIGALYAAVGGIYTVVINNQNSIQGTIEMSGKKITYNGIRPNKPLIKFFGQDPNGNLEVKLDSSTTVKDKDLTMPGLSLDDRITITFPGGQQIEFDHNGVYNDSQYYPFKENSAVKGFLQGVFLEVKEYYKNIENAMILQQSQK